MIVLTTFQRLYRPDCRDFEHIHFLICIEVLNSREHNF